MHNQRIITNIILAVLVLAGLIFLVRWYSFDIPKAFQIQERTITLEIADSDAERLQGLSGRENLNSGTGMLFVFRRAGYHAFWMPGMRFPIDIIWMDRKFSVVDVEEGVTPDTYPKLFYPSQEAVYVLEVSAGQAKEYGITAGTELVPIFSD